MTQKTRWFILLVVITVTLLGIAAVAADAQEVCVLHPLGDRVPCQHIVPTPWGPRALHAFDVIPCVHLVPCF
jgi:hypothetical protein